MESRDATLGTTLRRMFWGGLGEGAWLPIWGDTVLALPPSSSPAGPLSEQLEGNSRGWRQGSRDGWREMKGVVSQGGRANAFLECKMWGGGVGVCGLYVSPFLDLCMDLDGCTSCSVVNRLTWPVSHGAGRCVDVGWKDWDWPNQVQLKS